MRTITEIFGTVASLTALIRFALLTSPQGAALLGQFHFLPSPLLASGDLDAIPLSLQFQIRGTYQPTAP